MAVPAEIFKAYDIRGLHGEHIDADLADAAADEVREVVLLQEDLHDDIALAELIEDAWRLSAPKRLLAAYDAEA